MIRIRNVSLIHSPKHILKLALVCTLNFLRARPKIKAKIAKTLSRFKTLDKRLRRFAKKQKYSPPIKLPGKLRAPISALITPERSQTGKRAIYYYVDHTILCTVNTGIQRVVRRLGRALFRHGEKIHFVKWNSQHQKLVLLNQEELAHLAKWHGPLLSEEQSKLYPLPKDPLIAVGDHHEGAGYWLIVPEVPHITYQSCPVTLEIMTSAKHCGLKTAFIYYDAIPLIQPELSLIAAKHEIYMQQLLLADLIIPISHFSEQNLHSFFHNHEAATLTPKIATISLPGEVQGIARNTSPLSQDGIRKLILSVGTIEKRKNQLTLIHAFNTFCSSYPSSNWELALVGNIHADVALEIASAVRDNPQITVLNNIPDSELDELYRSCSFTVYPSIEEGFGLPILESLWYAKPCICANFGAMTEVAQGGGCLTVDVRETDHLYDAINLLIKQSDVLQSLSHIAAGRSITTWDTYANDFIDLLDQENNLYSKLGTIYYWINDTCTYPNNTGIQRVVRQLARSLIEIGLKLIPVKWNYETNQLYPPSEDELQHLARWNGPAPSDWCPWTDPSQASLQDWLLVPELLYGPPGPHGKSIKSFASTHGLMRGAWIFYDAIPWKMHTIYSPEATLAHRNYMEELNEFERVFAISEHSRSDLRHFLAASRMRTPYLDDRIRTCVLPGEFRESSRITHIKSESTDTVKILCVGTIEPRKNHLSLLEAFIKVLTQTGKKIELHLVGRSPFPDLAKKVSKYTKAHSSIHWEKNADDGRLHELYQECDFTVYPSLEEGFGLPILESLWNARPCICLNASAMAEVAKGGGCLTVATADPDALAAAIFTLVENAELRQQLAREAVARPFKTWKVYAHEVATHLVTERVMPSSTPPATLLSKDAFYNHFTNLRPRPILSICITTFNRAEWLSLSLKNLVTLLPNPREEIEIVVCDNTSTDHTPKVVKPYLHRSDFHYYRNPENVGMLGNLRVTANHATGQYIWVLGDDDLILPGSIDRVLEVIKIHPELALIYLNYAYTRQDNAKAIKDLDSFFKDSSPITPPTTNMVGFVHQICTKSENFFTAIYCLIFRRDHALRAYSQNTEGRLFSTMLTCIPTTYYVLNYMMNEPAMWIGDPQVVVNMNVSWMKYASIWILERLPEVHDLAEKMGADPHEIDQCRIKHLPNVMYWFQEIFESDSQSNADYFSASSLVIKMKHLNKFSENVAVLRQIYTAARIRGSAGTHSPPSEVFAAFEEK